ncbi:hypothetical protein Pla175_27330 [Pirellulimonas nuda]|uniref:Glycosyltransferase family 10 (Fucosyltransferase) n=1 Tax=Pirellulimonas nuda TaxID=2528009 RepID=A0A518DCY3_9BACT|nr:hypothetical protein Pla175_27330 [Pirellulimonas nuda]
MFSERGQIPGAQVDPIFDGRAGSIGDKVWEVKRESALPCCYWKKLPFDTVLLQTKWNTPKDETVRLIDQVRAVRPEARVIYLDWFAPLHLPNPYIFDFVDLYVKKQALIDRSSYATGMCDTNLVEYEAQWDPKLLPPRGAGVDQSLIDKKLYVGWNFATSSRLIRELSRKHHENHDRLIGLHCRMHVPDTASTWYGHMRRRCLDAVQALQLPNALIETTRVPRVTFLRELRASKMCFSPFGYGEVCWRDFEAVLCGAMLLKPDMSHIETNPNIYLPYETYVPVRWDLEDLGSKCKRYMLDEKERLRISRNAVDVWNSYVSEAWRQQWGAVIARST